ncbi:MAG: hypothetical protein NT004_16500 [Bacteroidetes bacterium]|nr:hypothetical protein [Bacteroidota bacterium]
MITDFYFLLGGHDLEMVEIENLLVDYQESDNPEFQIEYSDLGLGWGAKLSSYSSIISRIQARNIVGIELSEDIPAPTNYMSIDHHDDKSYLPSSIEQVAELLRHPLSRYQMLVAINDRLYIQGLMDYVATKEEIDEIRVKDRKAQGVTKTDEELALQSIHKNLTIEFGVMVVKSLTPKFSAITDRLFPYASLLIYNDQELNYYGKNIKILIEEYAGMIGTGKAYFRDAENGFWGVKQGYLQEKEILDLKNEIILKLTKQPSP